MHKKKYISILLWIIFSFSIYAVIQVQDNLWRIKTKIPFLLAITISVFLILFIAYKRSYKSELSLILLIFMIIMIALGWKNYYKPKELTGTSISALYQKNTLLQEVGMPLFRYLQKNINDPKLIVTDDLMLILPEIELLTWAEASSVQYIQPFTPNLLQQRFIQETSFHYLGTYYGYRYLVFPPLDISSVPICIFTQDEIIYAIPNFCNE